MTRTRFAYALVVTLIGLGSLRAGATADDDGDGVFDPLDNCMYLYNPPPLDRDLDLDGYGDLCDPDLNNDFYCDTSDVMTWLTIYEAGGPYTPLGDPDVNGFVNAHDFEDVIVPIYNGSGKPGPSGLFCAGTIPCDL